MDFLVRKSANINASIKIQDTIFAQMFHSFKSFPVIYLAFIVFILNFSILSMLHVIFELSV